MNPVDFIQTNLVKKLLEEGFPADVANSGALVGVDHYRRCSQASKKGAMFDDCLHYARLHATYSTPKADRPKRTRKASKSAGGARA